MLLSVSSCSMRRRSPFRSTPRTSIDQEVGSHSDEGSDEHSDVSRTQIGSSWTALKPAPVSPLNFLCALAADSGKDAPSVRIAAEQARSMEEGLERRELLEALLRGPLRRVWPVVATGSRDRQRPGTEAAAVGSVLRTVHGSGPDGSLAPPPARRSCGTNR